MGWLTGCFQRGMYKIKLLRAQRSLNQVMRKTDRIKDQINQVKKAQETWTTTQTNMLKTQERAWLQNEYNTIAAGYPTDGTITQAQQTEMLQKRSEAQATGSYNLEIAIQSIKEQAEQQFQVQLDLLEQEEESLALEKDQLELDVQFYQDAYKSLEANSKEDLKMLIPNNNNG